MKVEETSKHRLRFGSGYELDWQHPLCQIALLTQAKESFPGVRSMDGLASVRVIEQVCFNTVGKAGWRRRNFVSDLLANC